MGRWSEFILLSVVQVKSLLISFEKVVKSGEVGCWLAVVGSLVGVFWLRVMWLELSSRSEISCPLWSVVGEYHWW